MDISRDWRLEIARATKSLISNLFFFMRTRFRPSTILVFLFLLLGITSLAAAGYLLAQEEYVVMDGDQQIARISGRYRTVADVLVAARVTLRPEDVVRPSPAERPTTTITIQRARAVTVRTAAGVATYFSQQPHLAAFLAEIGLNPPTDVPIFTDGVRVRPEEMATRPLPTTLEIGKFVTITISDGRQRQTLRTGAATVGTAVQAAGIRLQPLDSTEPPPHTPLTAGMTITVRRAFNVTISVDGRTITTRTAHANALDVLADSGVVLIGSDYALPGPEIPLQPDATIHVVRVTEDFRLTDTPLPYQTIYQADERLEIDTRQIVSPGIAGILRQRIRVRYENGVAVSETVDGEWVAREPVTEVVGYGTKIVTRLLNTADGALQYWRVVTMRVTSYHAGSSGKPLEAPDYGITASGVPAQQGVVAVDRAIVPWRTWVYVPGYGVGYVGDTGGGVHGRWIDLGYAEDAYIPWSGTVDVYYLAPIPPLEDINFLLPEALP
ncbi:MAG TPA: ubiquitin-like domain-containing protein [Chloroflexota bacterium]|nr:ubiquitin-like domain-containing protein [Chloroflexota bacterium]